MSLLSTKDRWLYFFNGRLPKQCRTSAISAAEFLRERMPIQILLPNASLAIGKPVLHFGQVLFDPQAEVENNQRESAVNNIQVNNNIRNPNRIPQEQVDDIPDYFHLIISPRPSAVGSHVPDRIILVSLLIIDLLLLLNYSYSYALLRTSDRLLLFFNGITIFSFIVSVPNLMRHSPSLPPLAITSLLAAFQAAVSLTTLYQVHHLIHGILAAIIAVGSRKIRSKLIYKWFVPGKL